ncbi:MAG: CHAT domain-containing tetratricopeptide repeat protein [Cyanobacteria bacterium P01_H01_bin.35]
MDEQPQVAYLQLIKKLIESPSGEEAQILNDNFELVDPGLLATMIAVANDHNNENVMDFLTNLALQLGEILGSEQQPKLTRKETADIFYKWGKELFYISQYPLSFDCCQLSLSIYQAIGDRQGEANSLLILGNTCDSPGKLEKINFYEQSLAIYREIKDRQGEPKPLFNLGNVYNSLGEYELAITYLKESLAIYQEIGDREWEANCLSALGNTYHDFEKYEQALNYYKQSLIISREIKDYKLEANSLWNLADAHQGLREYEQAITYHEKSLAISREIKDYKLEANALESLGLVYQNLGGYERAITYHEESLAIRRDIKDYKLEGNSLGNLGNVYAYLGEYERAITYLEKSLAISREIKDYQSEVSSLGNLGGVYNLMGKHEQAIAYLKDSLGLMQIKNSITRVKFIGILGIAYQCIGQYEQAITYLKDSLAISREMKAHREEAISLINIGNTYCEWRQMERAIQNYRDSFKITTPQTMPAECFKLGRSLGNIGFTQGDWYLALEGYEPAMQAVEQLRKGSTTDKRRQEIIAEAISVYANALQCYINLKQYYKAIETADRSRARHLADLFYSSKDLYPKGEIPPEVEAYYDLQQQSNPWRFSDNDTMRKLASTRQQIPNDEAILEKTEELEAQKQEAWLKIRSQDQVLAGQLQPDPLSFEEMQALIPDTETAILNFYSTEKDTHIFILRFPMTEENVMGRELQPSQSKTNVQVTLHTCESQGYEMQGLIFDNWLKPYVENQTAWQQQMGKILSEVAKRLQLNQLISEHLQGIKELIIIPHFYLHQIPFAALPLNDIPIPDSGTFFEQTRGLNLPSKPSKTTTKKPPQQPKYLSDKFRLRIVPSCQILNFCHQREKVKPTKMGIIENATGDLIFTGYECETVATMHGVPQEKRLQYQKATINNYQDLLKQVESIHSSHHARSNLNNSLDSKLVLFDGDINLGRIFTWRFSRLIEVFLSCCETNLTLTQITDDPLSIASGFLCAGARNVVSTLWEVDDLATALFCILYYQEKQDKSRSEAMRQAQYKLRNLTGDELCDSYKGQLENYFEQQQWGENKAEIMKNVRVRLDLLCREKLPFVSPHYWSGFISQGLS